MFENSLVRDALLFLVILNPFAQMLYLSSLIDDTSKSDFRRIILSATGMTFAIYFICSLVGDIVIFRFFQVSLPSMRIFGGIITLYLAFSYIMKGSEGLKLFRGNITELAQQITMPVMVGAGGVWISMKMGTVHAPWQTGFAIAGVLLINLSCILGFQAVYKNTQSKTSLLIKKYFGIAMRFNAMLIGAVGVEMVIGGIVEYVTMSISDVPIQPELPAGSNLSGSPATISG